MSTLDLVNDTVPSAARPHWCRPDGEGVFGVLWIPRQGEMALKVAVARLEETAAERKLVIKEVARVPRGQDEAIYSRGEPAE
jgi:hypothetical protein